MAVPARTSRPQWQAELRPDDGHGEGVDRRTKIHIDAFGSLGPKEPELTFDGTIDGSGAIRATATLMHTDARPYTVTGRIHSWSREENWAGQLKVVTFHEITFPFDANFELYAFLWKEAARQMTSPVNESRASLVASLWLKTDDVAAFESFERAAARVMAKHGGRIDHVVRRADIERGDGPFEVHVVSFPDWRSFDAYRADADFKALLPQRERLMSRTEIWRGEPRETYVGDVLAYSAAKVDHGSRRPRGKT